MKKLFSTFILVSSCTLPAFALEFGTMGSQAFGMAGTGVAVKNSSWGLYYNPALIAADSKFSIALSGSIQAKDKNFWNIIEQGLSIKKEEVAKDPTRLNNLADYLQDNHLAFGTQDGLVFQLPDFGIGALAVGGFLKASAQGSATTNVDLKAFTNAAQQAQGGNLPAAVGQAQHAANQIQDAQISAQISSFTLLEIPVAYAYEFETVAGNLSVGVAAKYMNLAGTHETLKLDGSTGFGNSLSNLLKVDFSQNASGFGIDAGVLYDLDFISLGIVGKNLNSPQFKTQTQTITIDPQARAGVALNLGFWSLALDADLTQNTVLGSDLKNQMISLGTSLDFKFLSLRAGVATDLQHREDLIFALGLGLTFFDVGVQFGKKTSPLHGYQIPDYFALQVGAGFSF